MKYKHILILVSAVGLFCLFNFHNNNVAHAAASLTLTSPTLATDGRTVTATITGGTGTGYSPSTGVTGVILRSNGQYLAYASSTISGSTLTIFLQGNRLSTDTLLIDTSASGNLTDSGANTLITTTGTAVTNNSTATGTYLTAAYDDPALIMGGFTNTSNTFGSETVLRPDGLNTEFRTIFTGSQIEVRAYNYNESSTLKVSIDGGAYSTVTMSKNITGSASLTQVSGWQWITLARGLSDGPHTISFYYTSAPNFSGYSYAVDFLRVTGSSPAFAREPAYEGTAYSLTGGSLPAGIIANKQTKLVTGAASTQGYTGYFHYNWSNAEIRFRAKISSLKIWGFGLTQDWLLTVDGVEQPIEHIESSTVISPTGSSWGWNTNDAITGLDDTAYHDYTLQSVNQFSPGGGQYWTQLLFVHDSDANGEGGLDQTATPEPFATDLLTTFGDSITQQTFTLTSGGGIIDTRFAYGWKIAEALDLQGVNRGISGTTAHNFTGSSAAQYTTNSGEARVAAQVTAIAPQSQAYIDMYGTNDLHTLAALGGTTPSGSSAVTAESFQTSMENILTNILSTYPTAKILVGSILESSDANNSSNVTYGIDSARNVARLSFNASKQAAVATASAAYPSANIQYVDLDGLLTVTSGAVAVTPSDDLVDGLHPTEAGHIKIANKFIPYVADTGYTTSGPTSGVSGATSTNFTITLSGGATFTTDTITISDGDGGTFTPSTGSASSTSVTVAPTEGETSFTFTYTPASAGTKTLTLTNGQGWTDPSALTYTASVPPDVTAPAVSLTAPSDGATVSGSSVAISASSSDAIGVSGVQFKVDTSTNIGEEDVSSPYEVVWDSTGVADGSYSLIAVARDAAGNYATSSAITVTVENDSDESPSSFSSGSSLTTSTLKKRSLARVSSEVPIPAVPVASPVIIASSFTRDLSTGMIGNDVKVLQHFLNTHNFPVALIGPGSLNNETDTFGALTRVALTKFQAANGLPATGYFGPLTRALIASLSGEGTVQKETSTTASRDLQNGMRGNDVKWLQDFLIARNEGPNALALKSATATGYFGPLTREALIEYQKAMGIFPATGYFDSLARAHLESLGFTQPLP